MSNTNTQTNTHNAYMRVYTNILACNDNNEGYSWGFLVVKGQDKCYVYKGTPEFRGRIAAVQTMYLDGLALFENISCVIIPNTEVGSGYFRENTPWTKLVKLSESDYKLLTGANNQCKSRATQIISYLRRTVSGIDRNTTVYEVPEDTFTENVLRV